MRCILKLEHSCNSIQMFPDGISVRCRKILLSHPQCLIIEFLVNFSCFAVKYDFKNGKRRHVIFTSFTSDECFWQWQLVHWFLWCDTRLRRTPTQSLQRFCRLVGEDGQVLKHFFLPCARLLLESLGLLTVWSITWSYN